MHENIEILIYLQLIANVITYYWLIKIPDNITIMIQSNKFVVIIIGVGSG